MPSCRDCLRAHLLIRCELVWPLRVPWIILRVAPNISESLIPRLHCFPPPIVVLVHIKVEFVWYRVGTSAKILVVRAVHKWRARDSEEFSEKGALRARGVALSARLHIMTAQMTPVGDKRWRHTCTKGPARRIVLNLSSDPPCAIFEWKAKGDAAGVALSWSLRGRLEGLFFSPDR